MDKHEYVRTLEEKRMRTFTEMQSFIDECVAAHPSEPFAAEENQRLARYNAELDECDATLVTFREQVNREREHAVIREAETQVFGENRTAPANESREQQFRAFLRGERKFAEDPEGANSNAFAIRALDISRAMEERDLIAQGAGAAELRTLLWDTGNMASAVPTEMARSIWEIMQAGYAMFRVPATRFVTTSGGPMSFPKETTQGAGTQVIAQGTAIGGTDPGIDKMTLDSFKYGQLISVSSEVLQDEAFPVVPWVSKRIAENTARVIDADLVVGTGSAEPFGIMAAGGTGIGGTASTGGSLITPTYEHLVNLAYSVNDAYRSGGSAGWLLRDSTAGTLRKLRSGNGGTEGVPIWTPVVTLGIDRMTQPDLLLDWPVYVDTNVASMASNARIVGFGAFNAYYERFVGDFVFDRSDDFLFSTDLVAFRGKWRADGDLIDNTAWNILKMSVS